MTHNPYLQVTLSAKPLGLEANLGVTCQYVLAPRHRSKSGKGDKAELHAEKIVDVGTKREKTTRTNLSTENGVTSTRGRQGGDLKQQTKNGVLKKRKLDTSQEPVHTKKRPKAKSTILSAE